MNNNNADYAKKRKEKVISSKLGEDWEEQYPGASIDALYNKSIGDERKTIFCKIAPEVKEMFDEICENTDTKKSEFIENMIKKAYVEYQTNMETKISDLVNQFVDN